MPAEGLLAGAAEGAGLPVEAEAGEAATAAAVMVEAAGSTFGAAGDAAETTGGLMEGGVRGAEETTMAGTLPEPFFSSAASACRDSWPVSTATVVTVWGCTLAGV